MYKILWEKRGIGMGLLGGVFFLVSCVWQIGWEVEPCPFCWFERLAFGIIGLASYGAYQIRATEHSWGQFALRAVGVLWSFGGCVAAYHLAVQYRWVEAPAVCRVQPLLVSSLEDRISSLLDTPISSCQRIFLSVAGQSISFYFAIIMWAFAGICFYGVREKKS